MSSSTTNGRTNINYYYFCSSVITITGRNFHTIYHYLYYLSYYFYYYYYYFYYLDITIISTITITGRNFHMCVLLYINHYYFCSSGLLVLPPSLPPSLPLPLPLPLPLSLFLPPALSLSLSPCLSLSPLLSRSHSLSLSLSTLSLGCGCGCGSDVSAGPCKINPRPETLGGRIEETKNIRIPPPGCKQRLTTTRL